MHQSRTSAPRPLFSPSRSRLLLCCTASLRGSWQRRGVAGRWLVRGLLLMEVYLPRGGLSCPVGTAASPAVLWRPLQMLGWLRWHKPAILELLLSLGHCSRLDRSYFSRLFSRLFHVCLFDVSNSPKLVTMYC